MAAKWGYGTLNGPDTWAFNFEDARGERQSPINIQRAKAVYDPKLAEIPLKIKYSPETSMCIENNGHSVKCNCSAESTLTGGPLGNNVYRLIQFHLHWGSDDSKGAEHTIDGKVYSAELHLVHWNTTKYAKFEEAANKADGLAVLCVFIKPGNAHPGFDAISCHLNNVCSKGCMCDCADFDPSSLLPTDTKRYWTYPGSLTTPPCFESVQFILFEEVFEFSPEQLSALRSLKFADDQPMVDNFRPPCFIGSRKVRASFAK